MVDMNRNLVLNVLRTGAASRADVVRTTGLSPTTVSLIVSELIESGLINEVGEGKSSGGRPPLVLRLDDERNYIVGVKLTRHDISIAVTDLRAEVRPLRAGRPVRAWSRRADAPASVLDPVCAAPSQPRPPARLASVSTRSSASGSDLPGIVEAGTGVCRYSPAFGWRNVAVAGPIAERLGRPVLVDNDVNTLTVAEQWFGRGHGVDDFVVVTVGVGVGAGLVIDGKLCRGARGAAGEIGHLPVGGSMVRCRCGSAGAWRLSAPTTPSVATSTKPPARRDQLDGLSDTSSLTIDEVREAAESGRPGCCQGAGKGGPHARFGHRQPGEPAQPEAGHPVWRGHPCRSFALGRGFRRDAGTHLR